MNVILSQIHLRRRCALIILFVTDSRPLKRIYKCDFLQTHFQTLYHQTLMPMCQGQTPPQFKFYYEFFPALLSSSSPPSIWNPAGYCKLLIFLFIYIYIYINCQLRSARTSRVANNHSVSAPSPFSAHLVSIYHHQSFQIRLKHADNSTRKQAARASVLQVGGIPCGHL